MAGRSEILSAGIIPARKENGRWLYLALRAYSYWDFPKGVVEDGEDPVAAAMRELREETGITQAALRWGEAHHETEPYSRGKTARYYLAEVPVAEVELSPEHHEYRWLEADELRELLVPRVKKALDWAESVLQNGRA